jgi:trigger factor
LASAESCKRALEFSVPPEEVEAETSRVLADVQKRAKLPGFRPGKAPVSLIRRQFEQDIRQSVLENLVPKHIRKRFEEDNLQVIGTPDITDVHFHEGEPLRFKAEFEVVPDIELGDYQGLSVPYHEPVVTDEDIAKRLDEIREQKAEYVNIDPRPIEDGDYAVVALESLGGVEEPIRQDETMLHIGAEDTLQAFTENLQGASPGDVKEFEVSYPEDHTQNRLAGKTVHFRAEVKGLRRKELPEINDEFAQDLGDYRGLEELRDAIRKSIFAQREQEAQRTAKENLVDQLINGHEFPAPEAFVERQIRNRVEQNLRALAAQGVDPRSLNLDWQKVRETQRDQALKEVKGSMLLSRIAEREAIHATREEVDREIERVARQQREPFAAVRVRLEKEGTVDRIANHIQTEKTLSFLFEHARKTAEE